jgi:hypothetical protein
LGDAYGCGIVEHLSRAELKKLDEDAEQEFAKQITVTAGAMHDHATKQETHFIDNHPLRSANPSISIWNETDQQINDIDRRDSVNTNNSTNGAMYEPTLNSDHDQATSTTTAQTTQKAAVSEASKREQMLQKFNKPKLPTSINSMPQISQYSSGFNNSSNNNNNNNNNSNNKNNGGNQDSNV